MPGLIHGQSFISLGAEGGGSAPLDLYFNSLEPGGDGSDPDVLWADDFSNGGGFWYTEVTNPVLANKGWNGTPTDDVDPEGTNFGRVGEGVGGTNCISNGGHITTGPFSATTIVGDQSYEIVTVGTTNYIPLGAASNTVGVVFYCPSGTGSGTGTVMRYERGQACGMADHSLSASATEIYFRYYVKPLTGYLFGQEKAITFNKGPAGVGGIYAGTVFFGLTGTGEDSAIEPTFLTAPASVAGSSNKDGNQGNDYTMVIDHWNCIQVRIKFVGVGSDIMEMWCDDCGTDGLSHPGSPTLRMSYNNLDLRIAGDGSPSLGSIWVENWAAPAAHGEMYYDKIMCKTTGPIGFWEP